MRIIKEILLYSKKGVSVLITMTLLMFLYGFAETTDSISEADKEYELLLSSAEDLENKYISFYREEEMKFDLDLEVEKQLSEYLIIENEGKVFDVPYEIYINLSEDIKNVVDASLYVYQMHLEGDFIIEDGEYIAKEESEKISLQDGEFKMIMKKTLYTLGVRIKVFSGHLVIYSGNNCNRRRSN